jgi:hypothetical protein
MKWHKVTQGVAMWRNLRLNCSLYRAVYAEHGVEIEASVVEGLIPEC